MAVSWSRWRRCMAPAEAPTGFLRIAHRDLRTAMAMADSSVFEEDSWGFYIQQAIEKGLIAPPGTSSALTCSLTWPPCSHERSRSPR